MKNCKLILWINQSNGDTLGGVPLVSAILKQYPEVELKFACYEEQAYLLKHLPIDVIPVQGNYRNMILRSNPGSFLRKIKHIIDEDFVPIHIWLGNYALKHTWQNQVLTFNNQCKEKNIDIVIDDSEFGFIELPKVDVEVLDNSVYVESCQPISGQTRFQFDIYKMSLMFPKLNFYTVGSVNFKAKNVIDCSQKSLVELASISRKCKIVLGKGSSPFFCTLCEENQDKLKAIVGLWGEWKFKFWNENDDNVLLLDTEQEVMNILRQLSRSI